VATAAFLAGAGGAALTFLAAVRRFVLGLVVEGVNVVPPVLGSLASPLSLRLAGRAIVGVMVSAVLVIRGAFRVGGVLQLEGTSLSVVG